MESRAGGGGVEGGNTSPASVRASRELCFYCFDAILSHLEHTNCAPPDFADGKCAVCISWAKCSPRRGDEADSKKSAFEARGSLITMSAMRLHSEDFLRTIRDSAFEDPRQPPVTPEDIQYLRCSVSLILEDTYKTLKNVEDWEIGKHGVRVEFMQDGKKRSKMYPPETILARGWTKRETIHETIVKAGYVGEVTEEVIKSVKAMRFETSTCIVSFKEYLRHVEEMEKRRKGESVSSSKKKTASFPSPVEEKENTMIRRRKRYLRSWLKKVHPDKASAAAAAAAASRDAKWNSWAMVLAVAIIFSAVFFLRFHEATYDADYESFQSNYEVLGLERGAPLPEVKTAFKKLSLKWHPDKNPGCKECADMYVKISDAYKQIADYERGAVRLVNKPKPKPDTRQPTQEPKKQHRRTG